MRDSFLLFTEQKELIECLTDEQAGRLFKLLYNYAADIDIEIDNDIKLAFIAIRQQIDRNHTRYDEKCQKNSNNGKKGGAPVGNSNAKKNNQNNRTVVSLDFKTTENNPNNQNKRNKHNDNDNENENENENENVSFKEKEKKEKENFQKNSDSEINEINETQNITDPYISPEVENYFRIYEDLCPNLTRLRFERKNAQIRELLARFIDEIDDDVGYFKCLCQKANELKKICERQIDFKMLINNHIGIFNGKYEDNSFNVMDLFK